MALVLGPHGAGGAARVAPGSDDGSELSDSGDGSGDEGGGGASGRSVVVADLSNMVVDEAESKRHLRNRQDARATEISEALEEFAKQPGVTKDEADEKVKKPWCFPLRRALYCCVELEIREAVLEGEMGMTRQTLQRLARKKKTAIFHR